MVLRDKWELIMVLGNNGAFRPVGQLVMKGASGRTVSTSNFVTRNVPDKPLFSVQGRAKGIGNSKANISIDVATGHFSVGSDVKKRHCLFRTLRA